MLSNYTFSKGHKIWENFKIYNGYKGDNKRAQSQYFGLFGHAQNYVYIERNLKIAVYEDRKTPER